MSNINCYRLGFVMILLFGAQCIGSSFVVLPTLIRTIPRELNVSRAFSVSGTVYEAADKGQSDASMIPVTVKLFTKEGCTLCDRVKDILSNLRTEFPHKLEAVDITDADQRTWWDKYKYDIPVLHLNGHYWTKHRLTKELAVSGIVACREGRFQSPRNDEPNAAAAERNSSM